MADALRTVYAALMVVSGVASIFGNLLLLLVLLLNKELRTDTLGLTLSFSLSDLALGLSIIPFGVYNSLAWPSCCPSKGALCQGSGFIFLLLQTSSMHSLTWATVNKFTEICFALSYSSVWTAGRCRVVLVLVWLFCLVNATLPLLGFGSYVYSESRFLCCPSFTPNNKYFVLLWMLVGIMVPIVTMCSLYGYIVYVARKQARRGTFMCNELHCYYVPANNYLRSSIVMVTTSGEFIFHPDWSLIQCFQAVSHKKLKPAQVRECLLKKPKVLFKNHSLKNLEFTFKVFILKIFVSSHLEFTNMKSPLPPQPLGSSYPSLI